MVWFGLTQAEERRRGFDAATRLGGRAFILQFKTSTTVAKRGPQAGRRKFWCQHHQMDTLVRRYHHWTNACFYFLPNLGTTTELIAVHGDLLTNSFLLDVADIPNPVPPCTRTSGYHFAYLDPAVPDAMVTSKPFSVKVRPANLFLSQLSEGLAATAEIVGTAKRFLDRAGSQRELFFRNAALAVIT